MADVGSWTTIRTFGGDDARSQADFARHILENIEIEAQVLDTEPASGTGDPTLSPPGQAELSVRASQVTEACFVIELLHVGNETALVIDGRQRFPFGLASLLVAGGLVAAVGDSLSDWLGYTIMAGAYVAGRVFRVVHAGKVCSACAARAKPAEDACSGCGMGFSNRRPPAAREAAAHVPQ